METEILWVKQQTLLTVWQILMAFVSLWSSLLHSFSWRFCERKPALLLTIRTYVRTRMLSWGRSHQTHWGHGWHVIDLRLPIYPTNNPRLNAGCPLQEAVLNCRAGNNPMYKLTGENSALSSQLFSVRTVVPW